MLFPLSKSFCSSGLFQTGGSEPLRRRVWSVDHTGKHEKVQELHKLLTDKASYEKHLSLIARQAQEGARADSLRARTYQRHLQEIQERVQEESDERKRKMRQETLQYLRERADRDLERTQGFQTMQKDFSHSMRDMEERVRSRPPIWGEVPEGESRERRAQRAAAQKNVHEKTRQYFREQKELKARLADTPSEYAALNHKPVSVEKRKKEGLEKISRQLKDYDSFLDDIYATHHDRVYGARRELEEENRDRTRRKLALTQSHVLSRSTQHLRATEELARMKERVRSRPQSFGGYVPVHKSDRRLREEEADLDSEGQGGRMQLTSTSSFSATQPPQQRTLSPRTLGLTTKSS
mmetsp:Transcript_59814/g.142440  ORF Transcript_59814/g.142440 Transcript_59814/m.142440 type:complete len:351 (-) Transcript_59814:73-1125(-)